LELANVRVLVARAEDAAHDPAERETYDVAVARAVAPLVTLVELTLPFVRLGGILAAVKGSRVAEEIEQAGVALRRCGGGAVAIAPLGDVESPLSLVTVSKVEPSPPELPRRAGMPAKRPLR
jgi:16S rRNA (guanine527-N7)-methyltransferase